jgi:3',5'-cyclic AMP phosphodiesterase CpdA
MAITRRWALLAAAAAAIAVIVPGSSLLGGSAPAAGVTRPAVTTSPRPEGAGGPVLRLAVAGDVGTGGPQERATAAAMDRLEERREFDVLLLLGDNIYPDGDVAGAQEAVFGPFAGVLDGRTTLLAALGNHDVRTADGVPQLAAFGMPGRWYLRRLGPVDLIVLDSTRTGDPAQLSWLEATLAAPERARWTVVAQHHPPLSAGWHGDHEPSRRLLVPLFERYGVDLVLTGHDHDYQRSTPQAGVTYVVTGGAATLRRTGRKPFTAASASAYHFVELAVFADRMELRAVDQQQQVFDEVVLR